MFLFVFISLSSPIKENLLSAYIKSQKHTFFDPQHTPKWTPCSTAWRFFRWKYVSLHTTCYSAGTTHPFAPNTVLVSSAPVPLGLAQKQSSQGFFCLFLSIYWPSLLLNNPVHLSYVCDLSALRQMSLHGHTLPVCECRFGQLFARLHGNAPFYTCTLVQFWQDLPKKVTLGCVCTTKAAEIRNKIKRKCKKKERRKNTVGAAATRL